MAHESFEDTEVAGLLNEYFVSIKVDREERPDVDAVYMQVCQAMNGSGGWPLSVFMTPDQHPFFAGTYFPKKSAYGQPGFIEVLETIARKWQEDPASLKENGRQVTQAFAKAPFPAAGKMNKDLLHQARMELDTRFDDQYGGFGSAPKFPTPHILMFLLRYALLEQDRRALHMAEKTLISMYRGGMYDHLGGGFSRYSTDRKWLVPHFEKMLYDNALLAMAYTEAFQITGKPLYWRIATATLDYIVRDMTNPEGGFYSAQDADTGGEEGAFYTFAPSEIESVLGAAEGKRFCSFYGITEIGLAEGKSILNRLTDSQEEEENLKPLRKKLYEYRKNTRTLFTDDKVITEWNGLAIAALCKAAYALNKPEYLCAANKAMMFSQMMLTNKKGELHAYWRDGKAGGHGSLSDYAAIAWASLEMYKTDFHYGHIQKAENLCRMMVRKFYDDKQGDFFMNEAEAGLIFRPKEYFDGATPCGNSMAAYVFFELSRLTGEDAWAEYATRTVEKLAGSAQNQPSGHCFGLIAGLNRCYLPAEAVCVAREEKDIVSFSKAAGKRFLPLCSIAATKMQPAQNDIPGILKGRDTMGHPAAYYLCREGSCQSPVFTLEEMEDQLAAFHTVPGKAGST